MLNIKKRFSFIIENEMEDYEYVYKNNIFVCQIK